MIATPPHWSPCLHLAPYRPLCIWQPQGSCENLWSRSLLCSKPPMAPVPVTPRLLTVAHKSLHLVWSLSNFPNVSPASLLTAYPAQAHRLLCDYLPHPHVHSGPVLAGPLTPDVPTTDSLAQLWLHTVAFPDCLLGVTLCYSLSPYAMCWLLSPCFPASPHAAGPQETDL